MSFVDLAPGDIVYSQYSVVDTLPVKSAVAISKGEVYTMDSDGYLVELTAASDDLDNLNGAFQAMADSAAVAGESDGDRSVQCLCKRSRILLKAPADITPGDDVTIAATGTTVTPDTVEVSSTHKIGTVFAISTLNTNRTKKAKTAAGDLVEVDLIE